MARPFIPVPHVAVANMVMKLANVPFCCSFYYHNQLDEWDNLSCLELLSGFVSSWRAYMMPILGNDVTMAESQVKALYTENGPERSVTTIPTPGGWSTRSLPLNIAIYAHLHTKRRARDPMHYSVLGGIPIGVVEGNTITSDYIDEIRYAYANMIDSPYIDTAFNWSYVRYIFNKEYLPFGLHEDVSFGRPQRFTVGTRGRRVRNKPKIWP